MQSILHGQPARLSARHAAQQHTGGTSDTVKGDTQARVSATKNCDCPFTDGVFHRENSSESTRKGAGTNKRAVDQKHGPNAEL